MPRVGIVYVPFKNEAHIQEVFNSWMNLSFPRKELAIYIVPNSDPQGLLPQIRTFQKEAEVQGLKVTVLEDGINHGFAGNHNKGMEEAIKDGCEFVYLNNGDLKLDKKAITRAVEVAEQYKKAGAVQSLMMYWHEPEKINAAGGIFHIAGYGYADQNGEEREGLRVQNGQEIGYASGGATLYRAEALQKVGLLETGFFMYHEDLELGMRLRISGYENRIATESVAYHDYTFAINQGLFAWTETYRYIVTLAYWKPQTLCLIAPILAGVELATWVFSIKGGWYRAKWQATRELMKPKSWRLLLRMRKRAQRLRVVSDATLFAHVRGSIEAQEQSNWTVDHVANPVLSAYTAALKKIMRW